MSVYKDVEEPMELYQHKNEVLLTLSLKWSQLDRTQKLKLNLLKILQSWFNKRQMLLNCVVERTLRDGSVVVKVAPAPALCDLQELNGQTLTGKDGNTVTVLSISLTPTILDSQILDGDLVNIPPSASEPQAYERQQGRRSTAHSTATNSSFDEYKRSTIDCHVPVGHYCYMNNIYREEIKHIEKENKVRIKANVNVEFEAKQEDGSPEKALSEFTKLVQSSLPESWGSVIPLKFVDPDQWSDAMRVIQENKSKLLLALSCEEVTVCGPSQSQNAFSAALNAMQKRNASLKENKPAPRGTFLETEMPTEDRLNDMGLTSRESHLKPSTSSVDKPANVRVKSVDFAKVVKPKRKPGTKASTEAPLHQYHRTTTLLPSLKHIKVVSETHGSSTQHHTTALARDGATAGNENETCPICMCPLTNKKQLKCQHEFCYGCLQEAEKSLGPICPICKDVFGVIEGDQPDGTMTWAKHAAPLPGFPNCGHISISYSIPSGVQTKKHPNPGQPFFGTRRVAYLPDNKEGNEVLLLLKKAFDQRLIFTVGTSRTTGVENMVTWNDIDHKTSMTGGPDSYGYPDDVYLKRVKEELKAKGIKRKSEKHIGPICPICKDVFGVIEGDQPDGTMTWAKHAAPLPGFPNCGHISISYFIPRGVQTLWVS